MGGSSSRELEAAQSQVRRLTAELAKATAARAAAPAASAAKLAASASDKKMHAELQAQLSEKQQELEMKTAQLRGLNAELPRFKQEVASAKELLLQEKKSKQAKDEELSSLQSELKASKTELEALFGKLKFAEVEGAAARKLNSQLSDEKRALAEQQQAAAEESARLVSDASAALLAEEAKAGGQGSMDALHPVYGELLHDYGHKRLYLGSPTTLWAGTVLWERQRAFRQERAALIATAKGKAQSRGWPGSISIVETAAEESATQTGGRTARKKPSSKKPKADAEAHSSGEGGGEGGAGTLASIGMLIDGQHRLGAAHLLSQRGKLTDALSLILVEVYPPMEESGIKELFTEINKAEPVLLVDLPEGGASDSDNATLTAAAELLRERYPVMFKPSHGCRPPHINVDVMREEMHRADLLARESIASAEELVQWLEERNAQLGKRDDSEWSQGRAKTSAALQKAIVKAKDQGFYLGLGWEWLRGPGD